MAFCMTPFAWHLDYFKASVKYRIHLRLECYKIFVRCQDCVSAFFGKFRYPMHIFITTVTRLSYGRNLPLRTQDKVANDCDNAR